jgi:hypothetical protein
MSSSNNNVIMFPNKNQKARNPQTIEEVDEKVDLVRHMHIQGTIEAVAPLLFDNLSIAGFAPADDDSDLKHGALVVEAIRSLLCSNMGLPHPLQIIAENLFEEDEDGLVVSEKIKIVITTNTNEEEG